MIDNIDKIVDQLPVFFLVVLYLEGRLPGLIKREIKRFWSELIDERINKIKELTNDKTDNNKDNKSNPGNGISA